MHLLIKTVMFSLYSDYLCSHSTDNGVSYYRPSHDSIVGREREMEPNSRNFLRGVFWLADVHRRVAHGCRKSRMFSNVCQVSFFFCFF